MEKNEMCRTYEYNKKRTAGLYHILAPSVIGICICAICLCGTSWAWFSATKTYSVAKIQSATYTANVTAEKDSTDVTVSENEGISLIKLEKSEYKYTITADGTAQTGYCKIELGDRVYYTPQLSPGSAFTFWVIVYDSIELQMAIIPQWGTCTATEAVIDDCATIEVGTKPENNTSEENDIVTDTSQTTSEAMENTNPMEEDKKENTNPEEEDESETVVDDISNVETTTATDSNESVKDEICDEAEQSIESEINKE